MRVAAIVFVLCACGGDPQLHVRVEHEAGLPIARTVVSVYESASLTCADVAFSRVGPEELAAVFVTDQEVLADGTSDGALTGISRTDHKVIVARGYDADGVWRSAGCAQQDVVEDDVTLTIKTMRTVTASLVPIELDPDDPFVAIVAATDVEHKGIEDRRVAWTVYAPAGAHPITSTVTEIADGIWEPVEPSCTTANGFSRVRPIPPNVIGGYAVQMRVEWATQLPPLFTSFATAQALPRDLAPPNNAQKFCAIRIKGTTKRLVCLDGTVAREFSVTATGGSGVLTQTDSQAILPETVAVIAVANGEDRDVYAMTTRGRLQELFGAPAADNSTLVCGGATCDTPVDDVVVVPACGASLPAKLVVHLDTSGPGSGPQLATLDARGGGLTTVPAATGLAPGAIQLDNAGCVDRIDPAAGTTSLRQVTTFHVGMRNVLNEFVAFASLAVYNCNGTTCSGNDLVPGAGVSFMAGDEARMIVTAVDATGVVLSQVVLAPEAPNKDRFIERARSPAASLPDRMVVGTFDTDDNTDLFWTISGRRGTTFEIAYTRDVGPSPLEALSGVQTVNVASLDTADLTGDGFDDIIITGRFGAAQGVAVVPSHATAPVQTVRTDMTCAP